MDTTMKIVIARPQEWINRSKARTAKIWFYDVEALYNDIEEVCKELNINYEVRTDITPNKIINCGKDIFLGHHTHGRKKNVWHIKKGYVPGYMYFDKAGYSGWSEGIKNYNPRKKYIKGETLNTIKKCAEYIKSNSSKIKQPDDARIPENPYVLVLGQRPHDTVSALSYIDTVLLSKLVNDAFKNTNIQVYTKPHPMSTNTRFYGKIVEGSMHKLIEYSRAVYTVNSGSGFESLFHGKPVFTSGKCDYSPATIVVKNFQDIKDTRYRYTDTNKIFHFLTYCFDEYFVDCYDKNSIKKKILRCVEEYEI